jgi:hypothetical protein
VRGVCLAVVRAINAVTNLLILFACRISEDAADADARREELLKEQRQREFLRRSQVGSNLALLM